MTAGTAMSLPDRVSRLSPSRSCVRIFPAIHFITRTRIPLYPFHPLPSRLRGIRAIPGQLLNPRPDKPRRRPHYPQTTMRTPFLLSLLFAALFTSCEKNGDGSYDLPDTTASSDIVGTWSLERYDSETTGTTSYQGITFDSKGTGTLAPGSAFRVTFQPNGEVTVAGNIIIDIEATVGGQVMNNQIPGVSLFKYGTFELKDDVLVVTDPGGERNEVTLTTLTETELVVEGTIQTEYTLSGMTSTGTQKFLQVFVRVE